MSSINTSNRVKENWNRIGYRNFTGIADPTPPIWKCRAPTVSYLLTTSPAEHRAGRGRRGEAAMTVQTSQVIFRAESNKTPMSPIKQWWCYGSYEIEKGRENSSLEIRFILVASAQSFTVHGNGDSQSCQIQKKKGKIGNKSVSKQQNLHTDL